MIFLYIPTSYFVLDVVWTHTSTSRLGQGPSSPECQPTPFSSIKRLKSGWNGRCQDGRFNWRCELNMGVLVNKQCRILLIELSYLITRTFSGPSYEHSVHTRFDLSLSRIWLFILLVKVSWKHEKSHFTHHLLAFVENAKFWPIWSRIYILFGLLFFKGPK